jgi:F0F1-type ATP synthase assembly protein I
LQNKKSSQKEINSAFVKAGPYLNIGYFFIGAILLFGYFGYKADQWAQTDYIFLLSGLFMALGLGFYNMFKVLSQLNDKSK